MKVFCLIRDGWNLLMELDGLNMGGTGVPPVVRKYTWGLDLSGTPQGAGGVGGLVAALDTNGTPGTTADDKQYFYYCDAMGNVGQVVDATSGVLAAQYDYTDPFGGAAASGAWAAKNPFRFSTKYFDGEVDYAPGYNADANGLYYYGYRYYSPRLGRFADRDPSGEQAGANLFIFVHNAPANAIDYLGLETIKVEFNSFIPGRLGKWVPEPYGRFPIHGNMEMQFFFKTDERGFGGGSSRLKSTVTIDPTKIGKPSAAVVSTLVGASHRLNRITFHGELVRQWVDTETAVNYGVRPPQRNQVCKSIVCDVAQAAYPFFPATWFAEPIDYTVCWTFTISKKNWVTVDVEGTHDLFPNYEALIHRPFFYSQYQFDTAAPGPDNTVLSTSTPFVGRGLSVRVNATTPCCP